MKLVRQVLKTPESFFIILFLYMEVLFQAFRFGTVDNLVYKILFAIFYGLVFGSLVSMLPKVVGKIVSCILLLLITIYFLAQIIYSGVFDTYLSLMGTAGVAGQALDFMDVILSEVRREWWIMLLYLIPFAAWVVFFRTWIAYERHELKLYGLSLAAAIFLFLVELCFLRSDKDAVYPAYEVYRDYTSVNMAVEKLGVCESFYLDLKSGILDRLGIEGAEPEFVVVETTEQEDTGELGHAQTATHTDAAQTMTGTDAARTEEEHAENNELLAFVEETIDTSPNVLEIDLKELTESEDNASVRALHEYIDTCTPTNKNEYTGMFEGYNVIFVVAEGFSGFCVDQQRTPMLYKMCYEGFVFDNYYTPLWYGSTLGGEYADLTGLMPANGSYLSMARAGSHGNDMLFTLSEQLKRKGYTARGYHNNDYTYYDRHISHPNMGLEWTGMGNGLEYERKADGSTLWPQSDQKMVEDTIKDYINDQPFYTYYLTVSGHVMYNFTGNDMAIRHKDKVESLSYSDTTKAYLACQYELELAMETLVSELEKGGVADRTVIVLTADHVPYDNKEVVDELAGKTLDSTFEWYKNKLIIWSASMEEPVYVSKYCSSLDVLPTMLNLMGLPYDSRMLAGQDILSDSEGLVIFNDRSFFTDRVSYNANTGETKSMDGSPVDEDYVQQIQLLVKNKFNMAETINKTDYYRYIDEAVYGTE